MRRVAFALAGLVMIGAGPALAQYGYPPRPMMSLGGMPPEGVFEMVRQMGLEPVGRPMRNGPVFIQQAADYYGKPLRVVVDAARAQVISVESIGGAPTIHGGPYASTGAPYWRGPRGHAMPDDDEDFAPPGSIMGARPQPHSGMHANVPGQPPQTQMLAPPAKPKAKSAAVTPQHPPTPRKRPASAPQETAGSVEPIAPAAPPSAPTAASPQPAPAPAAKPPTPEMTPVAPLN